MASLERRLGLFSVVTISISSMVGSGIFVLPGIGFATTGPSIFIAFLLSALCILPAAMSKAELATAMPTSGGTYVYVERTFGPLAGTVSGLGLFLSILLKASFSLMGIGAYFSVLSSFPLQPTIMTFLVVICVLNIFGVGKVSGFLTFVLFVTVISLTLLAGFSIPMWEFKNLTPLMTEGPEGLLGATALVFVSFAGVTKVAAIAEEVKVPEKNLPRGILLSLMFVTFLYCGVSFILAGVYESSQIAGELKPLYILGRDVGGQTVGVIFAVVAILTMVNTSNAGILAGSRFPFAMARDNLIPKAIGKLHDKFLTPIISIILSGIIIAIVLTFLDVAKIAKFASAFMILIYIVENIAVIILRESRAQWYKPAYKAPMYPILQIFGIISGGILIATMGKISFIAILSIAIPGIILYAFYSRKRTTRKGVIGIRGKRNDLIQEQNTALGGFCSLEISGEASVVVSLFGKERSPEMLIEMGIALGEHNNVEVASIMEIPEQTDLHDVIDEPAAMRSLRRRIIAMANEKNESITFDPVVSHDVARSVYEISQRLHCNWLLTEWGGRSRGAFTIHNPIGWLKSHLHCNLATFKDAGVRYIRKIMVHINNDSNDQLVMNTAQHLAEVFWADITLVSYISSKSSDDVEYSQVQLLNQMAASMKNDVKTKIVKGINDVATVVDATVDYDLLLIGGSEKTLLSSVYGTYDDKIMAKASCSVLAVHASTHINTKEENNE